MQFFTRVALLTVSQIYPLGSYETRSIQSTYLPYRYAMLKLGVKFREEVLAKVSLLYCIAGYLLFEGLWNDTQGLEEQCIGIRKELLGPDHISTRTSMANLVSIYRNQGRWEVEKLVMQVETRKTKLGERVWPT